MKTATEYLEMSDIEAKANGSAATVNGLALLSIAAGLIEHNELMKMSDESPLVGKVSKRERRAGLERRSRVTWRRNIDPDKPNNRFRVRRVADRTGDFHSALLAAREHEHEKLRARVAVDANTISSLRDYTKELRVAGERSYETYTKQHKRIAELEATVARYTKALEFYAEDRAFYNPRYSPSSDSYQVGLAHPRVVAREALEGNDESI